MSSIRDRLLGVEDYFLSAVIEEVGSLESFEHMWTTLAQDVESAILSSSLDEETISLARDISYRISVLADTFHDLYVDNETLTHHFLDEVDAIFSQLTVTDTVSHPTHVAKPSVEDYFPCLATSQITDFYDLRLSPTPSLVSLSTIDDNEEDMIPVPIIGRKRSASSLDDARTGDMRSDRVIKRLRSSYLPSCDVNEMEQKPLVGCASSDGHLSLPSITFVSSPALNHCNQNAPLRADSVPEQKDSSPHPSPPSRKRRLSDGYAHISPKRPRGLPEGPRLHTVSDPFPISSLSEAQSLDELFDFGSQDPPSISWSEVGPLVPVCIDLFDAWDSLGAVAVNCRQKNGLGVVTCDLEPTVSSPLEKIVISPSASDRGVAPGIVPPSDSVAVSMSISDAVQGRTSEQNSVTAPSTDDVVLIQVPRVVAPSTMLGSAPPSYECGLPNIATSQPTEPDVISLYTTLLDSDPAPIPAACGGISQPALDLSLAYPPTFSESMGDEGDWAQFLAVLDQPLEVVFPSPPPPYDPSIARLLEGLLQPAEVINVPGLDRMQVLSDKQEKLKELEAAKEAVRRLEAEVGITA